MRIAQVAPVIERVPPKAYGGTERVCFALTEELVRLGHDVTLFATGDSHTSAKLVSVIPKGLRELRVDDLYGPNQWSLTNIGVAYERQKEFDIIHDHNGFISLPTANISKTPVVMTLHGAITPINKRMYEILKSPYLVAISDAQTQANSNLNFIGTVHNGLYLNKSPYFNKDNGYLLYVGRFSPEKGVHLAIDTAVKTNIPLIIAAKLDDKDKKYFKEFIKPRLNNPLVKWVGEVDEKERNKLMSHAKAFLHPTSWREPFGLTLIEAMATGCPVVAFNRGSISELVIDGKTGFVVDDLDGMVESVLKISQISRWLCRSHAIKSFSAKKMATEYEALYYQILNEKLINHQLSPTSSKIFNDRDFDYAAANEIHKRKEN